MEIGLGIDEPVDCRPHPRGSVRRASGFVLTGKPQGILFKLAYGGIPRIPAWSERETAKEIVPFGVLAF